MTVTTTYNLETVQAPMNVAGDYNEVQTAVTALANGGYAVVAVDELGYADLTIFNAAGGVVSSNAGFRASDVKLATLANGDILLIGTVDNTIDYRIFAPNGAVVDAETLNRTLNITNASVAATTGYGFATAFQLNYSGTDSDIFVHLNNQDIDLESSSGTVDENPSIARLNDGGFAVAWDRKAVNGNTTLYYEVLNANGSSRKAATLLDSSGTINRQPSVVALKNGGFAITYEDNGWTATQSDITQATFTADGTYLNIYQASTSTKPDGQVSSAVLSDGTIATVFTNTYSSTDTDVQVSFFDTVTGTFFITNLGLATSNDPEGQPTISALGNDKFAVSYFDAADSIAKVGVYDLRRSIFGDNADNVLAGDTQHDSIYGEGGNDIIHPGGVGNNDLHGDAGYDQAIFTSARASYTLSQADGETIVTGADGSVTTLVHVEVLSFSDQNVFTPAAPRDMDGNGFSDMVLRNSSTGEIRVWSIATDGTLASTDKTSKQPSTNWTMVGTGQFNFATDSYADILMQNTANGNLQVYEMAGHVVSTAVPLGALSTGWNAVTTGDFNGDGQSDIVMLDGTGQVKIWMMNGTTATAKVNVGSPGYVVVDTGDFNGDGKSDLLLQHNSQVYVWLMNGSTRLETDKISAPLATGWQAVSSGDFNGDGKSDILLWNSTTGSVKIWEMNGSTVIGTATVGTASAGYHVTGTGDFNGDGKSDIVFQKTDGHVQEWLMDGSTIASKITVGSPGSTWSLVAGTGA